MNENILTWYVNGEKGMSSEVMAATALGKSNSHRDFHPLDPADLNRCIKLVDAAPEIKNAFPSIAALSPQWSAIIANWDDLRTSFISEVGYDWCNGRRAPNTYNKMQHVLGRSK